MVPGPTFASTLLIFSAIPKRVGIAVKISRFVCCEGFSDKGGGAGFLDSKGWKEKKNNILHPKSFTVHEPAIVAAAAAVFAFNFAPAEAVAAVVAAAAAAICEACVPSIG
jgi:hypothetical protein